jgi:hypothetical protein
MRSWLFGVFLSKSAERAPDAELLAVTTILHDLGLTDRYTAENRFEVDGANAAHSFLKGRGISTQQMQVVWDAIALHTTRSIALHKEPEVAIVGNRLHLGRRRRPVLVVVSAGDFILLIENLVAEEVGSASRAEGTVLLENRYLTVNSRTVGLFDLASDTVTGFRARLLPYCGFQEKSPRSL